MKALMRFDWILLGATALLYGIGILVLYSLSPDSQSGGYAMRQIIFGGIGMASLCVIAVLDYRHIQRYSTILYLSVMMVLAGVLVWGKTVNGTEGWIHFGFIGFQPVEISKLVLILFLASFIAKKKTELGELVRLIVSLILAFVMILLVLEQPDLGSALVLAGVWVGMTMLAGMRVKHFVILLLLGICVAATGWTVLAPYQKSRILTVMSPHSDPQGAGYNVIQATLAVGSGGMMGKGIGHGSQSQLNFLPEKHTDFIFSVIAEELGVIGSFLVLFLYGIIFYRLNRIAQTARDNFGYLTVVGIMVMLFIQMTVNIGMNIGLLPVTGIPLPLLSYGGSSLVTVLLALGMATNIYVRRQDSIVLSVSLDRSRL